MKRSFSIVGLLALLGCGGLEDEGGTAAAAPTAQSASVTAEPTSATSTTSELAVAARVGRFALAPLATAGIAPQAWGSVAKHVLPEEGADAKGHFDPAQVQAVEALRLRAQTAGGVR